MRTRPAVDAGPEALAAIDAVLDRFGSGPLLMAASTGVRVVHLRGSEAYRDRSRALRRLASGVDDWPVPPPVCSSWKSARSICARRRR